MIIDSTTTIEECNEPSSKTLTVKQLDTDDQPRERALKHGVNALSTADLLALILRVGIPGKPITELCRDIMRANAGNIHTLERRTRKELLEIKGIGNTKAIQIEAVMELIRRYNSEEVPTDIQIKTAEDIVKVMRPHIGNLDHEEVWAVFLSRNLRIIRLYRISQGGLSSSVFDLKMMMKQALLENTESLILCHNHPSGNLKPSSADENITRICYEACRTMQIRMIDHVIITASEHFSFNDNGRLC